jgi:hypothetical protein
MTYLTSLVRHRHDREQAECERRSAHYFQLMQELRQDMYWKALNELIVKYQIKKCPIKILHPHTGVLVAFADMEKFSQFVWDLVCKNNY